MSKSTLADMARITLILGLIVAYLISFWVSYDAVVPRTFPALDHWYLGWMNGFFIVPTFILNVVRSDETATIFQAGADLWYQLWYLIGLATFSFGIRALFGLFKR